MSTDLPTLTAAAKSIVRETVDTFPGRVTLSCSFGGPSGMVLLDLALDIDPALNVFVADTELLFPETYALLERVERRYGIAVDRLRPRLGVAAQNVAYGEALWARDPDACCALRKVEPLREHVQMYDAWMTALRRDQSRSRSATAVRAWDAAAQVVKIAPLAEWTEAAVWAYVRERDIPVNALHADGYPSIGCTHCTRRAAAADGLRAGRWAEFDKVECGIHGA